MATIISCETTNGTKRRCDGTCHNAKTPKCKCICGGFYHGSKRNGTFERIRRQQGQAIIAAARQSAADAGHPLEVCDHFRPEQPHLPIIDAVDNL